MTLLLRRGLSLLGILLGWQLALPAVANTCRWDNTPPGPMDFQADVGNVYVPRDAAIGSIFGPKEKLLFTNSQNSAEIRCSTDGSVVLEFNARATSPMVSGINACTDPTKIFQTNIDGVGVCITLEFPFNGTGSTTFYPVNGVPTVPFDAVTIRRMISPFLLWRLRNKVTLVKTGPIAPGAHTLNRQLFDGFFTGLGLGLRYGLHGTIIQSQCAVGANPVSVDPVPLGDWNTSDFTHPGFTTAPTRFSITLSSCEADPSDTDQATAYIRLDGANGSQPVGDGSDGVFSLSNGSAAAGMGIQILHEDGVTPVPLGADVSFGTIENNKDKTLGFTARFYQTAERSEINGGNAEGALAFTLTYQ